MILRTQTLSVSNLSFYLILWWWSPNIIPVLFPPSLKRRTILSPSEVPPPLDIFRLIVLMFCTFPFIWVTPFRSRGEVLREVVETVGPNLDSSLRGWIWRRSQWGHRKGPQGRDGPHTRWFQTVDGVVESEWVHPLLGWRVDKVRVDRSDRTNTQTSARTCVRTDTQVLFSLSHVSPSMGPLYIR